MSIEYLNAITLAEKIAKPEKGDCPYTLFLGAGASVSSGIPTASGMVRSWQELLYKSKKNIRKIEKEHESEFLSWLKEEYPLWKKDHFGDSVDPDYPNLFGHFYQQPKERQLYIERIIEGKKPSFGYLYLAGLIADERFNRVLTTNFDDLANDALTKYYNKKPIVCAFDSAVAGIRVASQRAKIIKLHGDFLYDNIRNMKHELKSLDSNMEEKMYEMCKDFGLIVVGYSGEDESIMAPLRDMIRKPEYLNMGLHWCIRKNEDDSEFILPKKLRDLKNYHGDKVHIYIIDSFDSLMEEMFLACNASLPVVLTDPHRHSLPKEFYEAVREGSSEELTETMRKHLNLFIENARTQIDISEYEVIQADIKWEIGAQARKSGNTKEAKRLFDEGYALIENFLGKNNSSLNLKIRALGRKTGICIGLAKLAKANKSKSWKNHIDEAITTVEQGCELSSLPEATDLPITIRRTFPFNGCCAFSLLCEWENNVPDDVKTNVNKLISEIRQLDHEGEHLKKLFKDSDFSYLKKTWTD